MSKTAERRRRSGLKNVRTATDERIKTSGSEREREPKLIRINCAKVNCTKRGAEE